jgi:hypothetical protein
MAASSRLPRYASTRPGLSLVELTLALVLLTAMMVSLARQTGIFLQSVSSCPARSTAADIARAGVGLDLSPLYQERCGAIRERV